MAHARGLGSVGGCARLIHVPEEVLGAREPRKALRQRGAARHLGVGGLTRIGAVGAGGAPPLRPPCSCPQ